MVNERDEGYDHQEEGEYHFSDEDAYEIEPEAETETETTKVAPVATAAKKNPLANLGQYRRVIIGVVVFAVLLFVVYKIVVSPSSQPTTEFTEPAKPPVQQQQQSQQPTPAQQPSAITQPTTPTLPAVQQPNQMAMPTVPVMNAPQQPPATTMPAQNPMQTYPQPSSQVPSSAAMGGQPNVTERLSALEQQNVKIMTAMGAEYAQRMADAEAQNTALQAKVRELNTRIANMESTLNQITRMLTNSSRSSSSMSPSNLQAMPPARVSEPKTAYSVQAIIPGRAWLKSDSGDTVTVAEGDVLKSYGRIVKIDPYDGVVEIDTGTRTVALSYGSAGE